MATSKRNRKAKHVNYKNRFVKKFLHGRMWAILLINGSGTLKKMLCRELRTSRMHKKLQPFLDYDNMETPLYGRWMIPLRYNSTSKRSRIKNFFGGNYVIKRADEILHPSGKFHTQNSLINYRLAKGLEI